MNLKSLRRADSSFIKSAVDPDGKIVKVSKLSESEYDKYYDRYYSSIGNEEPQEEKIESLRNELEALQEERKQLQIDMEEEVGGAATDEEKEAIGNRYGEELDTLDQKISNGEDELEKAEEELKRLKSAPRRMKSGKGFVDLDQRIRCDYTQDEPNAWLLSKAPHIPSLKEVMNGAVIEVL